MWHLATHDKQHKDGVEDMTEMDPWHKRAGAVFSVNIQEQFYLCEGLNDTRFQSLLRSSWYHGPTQKTFYLLLLPKAGQAVSLSSH